MAGVTGLEPATSDVTGRRRNRQRLGNRVIAVFEMLQFVKTRLCQFWHVMKLCEMTGCYLRASRPGSEAAENA